MTKKEAFELGLPEEVYYVAGARGDGGVPMAKKAIDNEIFFELQEAVEIKKWNELHCKPILITEYCVVKAWIIPMEVVK